MNDARPTSPGGQSEDVLQQRRDDIDDLVKADFDPAAVSREALCNYLLEPQYGGNRCFQLWAKSSFDKFLFLGFDLDAEDFIIIDDKTEPALRNLCGELHG